MDNEGTGEAPTITPPCCEVWPQIAPMAHILVNGVPWRVQFCPSCGAERRFVNAEADEVIP